MKITSEPIVTIILSESAKLNEGETMPLSRANNLFADIDKSLIASPYYAKTRFAIDFIMNGRPDHYEGRQDFGDGDDSLIEHIAAYHAGFLEDAYWAERLLKTQGQEVLNQDREIRKRLLNEFVPYLKLHCELSKLKDAALNELQNVENITDAERKYHNATLTYVVECRRRLNRGNMDFPEMPRLADFDEDLKAYRKHVEAEIALEAAAAGMTVEQYAANGYMPYSTTDRR